MRAAGKGLLLDCISRIVTGERFTVATYTADEDELRKRITSIVLAGDRLVMFDNLGGKFGNATLDAALTGTRWKDRLLGVNRMVAAPMYQTWYATGNNVAVAADTARRICHCRLESPLERPEERSDLRHRDRLGWVGANRGRLLAAALTILRGYCAAGRLDQRLPAWGCERGQVGVGRGQPDLLARTGPDGERAGALRAVSALASGLKAPRPADQIRAADLLLQHGRAALELEDLAQRVQALEERLKQEEGKP